MIHPYLMYCNIIWGGASLLALNRLVCLQKRALRIIMCSHFRAPSNPLFAKLGILKLQDIHKFQILMFVYKFKNNLVPRCCMHLLHVRTSSSRYNLRHEHDFIHIAYRTLLRKKSIAVAGPELWNVIPDLIKCSISVSIYKIRLVDFLKSSYFSTSEN